MYIVPLTDEGYGESYYVIVKAKTIVEAKAKAVLKSVS